MRDIQGLEQQAMRGDLGEGGVQLANVQFLPNDLGAGTEGKVANDEERTRAEAKRAAHEIKKVKMEIAKAYKKYDGAKQMKASLENAEAKVAAAHVQPEKTGD